jgi:Coenzyme PQQ synthesis protein D (PqqD)
MAMQMAMQLKWFGRLIGMVDMDEEVTGETASEETLTVPLSYKPRKSADVLELDMGDGLILYNHDGDLVHHLNPSAGIIWQLCEGDATVGQLGREIAEEYGLEVETVQSQVASVIAEFDTLGLVEDPRRIELREMKS